MKDLIQKDSNNTIESRAQGDELEESYKDLFAHPINENLPKYLTLLYRFFGLWVTTVGMLITSFTIVTRLGTTMARGFIQISFFITLIGISIIEYIFIT